jgi:hypothetical protein
MLKIKNYKYVTTSIENYFNTYLFDVRTTNMKYKKLFIIKNNNQIIGSFFINEKYNILDTLYIVEKERGKGYCSQIINYLEQKYLIKKGSFLYFDVEKNNIHAKKCYESRMEYIGVMSHDLIYKIYKFKPNKNKVFLRYRLAHKLNLT